MDRMRACGVCDVGSIPTEGTSTNEANCLASCRKRKAFCYGELVEPSKRYTVLVEKDYPTEGTIHKNTHKTFVYITLDIIIGL